MLRTALLGGNSITLDADLSKYIETLSEQGVIEGLEVSSGSVAAGKAWVKATRSNGETIMVLVQNTEVLAVDTSGTKKIWLEIKQEAIDNGALNNEDGTGIAEIKTGPSVPSQNFLLLASVAENVVKDERNLIPKIQSVAQRTDSLEEKLSTAEGQIADIIEKGTPDYLGKVVKVGEVYQEGDEMVIQDGQLVKKNPTVSFVQLNQYVGDYHYLGEFTASEGMDYKLSIKGYANHDYYAVIVFSKRKFNSKSEAEGNTSDHIHKHNVVPGDSRSRLPNIPAGQRVYVGIYPYTGYPMIKFSSCSIEGVRGGLNIIYHPRSVKPVGKKVECTVLGIHSNGKFVGQAVKMELSKKISGTATAERTAPSNGILFYKGRTNHNSNGIGPEALINGVNVCQKDGESKGMVFVPAGTVTLKTKYYTGAGVVYSSTLELLEFIPLS